MIKTKQSQFGKVFSVASGNFLEMFDFFIFGFYALYIAQTFFPSSDKTTSLILTFLIFGAGFLMRPLGAIVLGSYVDRVGRRRGLLMSLSIMALGTLCMAFTPGYSQIGILAPIIVLVGRLLQGFSAGVEVGGVSVYLFEIASPRHKGFYVSWQLASQQVAIIVAAIVGYSLNSFLSNSEIVSWAWRIPFFIACLIIPFVFIIRRSLQETQAFLELNHHPSFHEIFHVLRQKWIVIIAGMLLVSLSTVSFYLITVYTPTFAQTVLHLSNRDSLIVTFFVALSNFIWLPIMGALSDRIGRRALLFTVTILALLTVYPAFVWLVENPTFEKLLMVELWFSFIYASYNATMIVALIEVMPISIRTVGFSLAYSLATAIFGGFTLAIATDLIHLTGNNAAPGLWFSFVAFCALIGTIMLFRPGLKGNIF